MRIQTIFLSVLLILLLAVGLSAQAAPKRVLANADLVKFIKDFKALGKEFETLGVDMKENPQDLVGAVGEFITALKGNAESKRILSKYGWNDSFYVKFGAILLSCAAIKMEEEFAKADPEIKASLAEIDNNKDLSPAQKKQYKDQVAAAMDQARLMQKNLEASVHVEDRKLVRQNWANLGKVFEGE
jgi:hypothetical protein